MTKKDLQKELLEKVKPGTKPSHLKRLKRSKSDSDIPKVPPLPLSEIEQLKKENEQLKSEIQQTQERLKGLHDFAKNSNSSPTNPTPALSTLTEGLQKKTDLNILLQDQLKEKQSEIENLRKQLEINPNPTETNSELTELDQSLITRHQSLKDWFIQYGKNQQLEKELSENIEQASEELISQDKKISHLQNQVIKLKQTNQSLNRDLNSAQRLAELRKVPYYSSEDKGTTLKYALYSLLTVVFSCWLVSSYSREK